MFRNVLECWTASNYSTLGTRETWENVRINLISVVSVIKNAIKSADIIIGVIIKNRLAIIVITVIYIANILTGSAN